MSVGILSVGSASYGTRKATGPINTVAFSRNTWTAPANPTCARLDSIHAALDTEGIMAEKFIVCIVQTAEMTGVAMVKDEVSQQWNVRGFQSVGEGLSYFETAYNRNHMRGFEGSMSALINGISFRPSIVTLSMPELKAIVEEKRVHHIRNCSGRMSLLPLVKEKSDPIWEAGNKPHLI